MKRIKINNAFVEVSAESEEDYDLYIGERKIYEGYLSEDFEYQEKLIAASPTGRVITLRFYPALEMYNVILSNQLSDSDEYETAFFEDRESLKKYVDKELKKYKDLIFLNKES